jgi:hypothetical protein
VLVKPLKRSCRPIRKYIWSKLNFDRIFLPTCPRAGVVVGGLPTASAPAEAPMHHRAEICRARAQEARELGVVAKSRLRCGNASLRLPANFRRKLRSLERSCR